MATRVGLPTKSVVRINAPSGTLLDGIVMMLSISSLISVRSGMLVLAVTTVTSLICTCLGAGVGAGFGFSAVRRVNVK